MAAEGLTSVFDVWNTMTFIGGLALGFNGKRGVDFVIHTTRALRGEDPHKSNPHTDQQATRGQPRDSDGQFTSKQSKEGK